VVPCSSERWSGSTVLWTAGDSRPKSAAGEPLRVGQDELSIVAMAVDQPTPLAIPET